VGVVDELEVRAGHVPELVAGQQRYS